MAGLLAVLIAQNTSEVEVPLATSDLEARLRAALASAPSGGHPSARVFTGGVTKDGFKLRRILRSTRGGTSCIVQGFFRPGDNGSLVRIAVRPSWPMVALNWMLLAFAVASICWALSGEVYRGGWAAGLVLLFLAVAAQRADYRRTQKVSEEVRLLLLAQQYKPA